MKLIIDIPYFVYNHIKEFNSTQLYELNVMMAIQKGLLLENTMEQAKIEELEKIKAEIKTNRDEWIKGQDAEWYTYDRCLCIIEKYISELKGDNK